MKRLLLVPFVLGAFAVLTPVASASWNTVIGRPNCDVNSSTCTETLNPYAWNGYYTGHDEPSVLFYSGTAGSGNNQTYTLTLPSDPPKAPTQDGTGGTFNFQLHPAFWFGMAMCDDQSAPNPGGSSLAGPNVPCRPNSDSNIYTGTTPGHKGYIGQHPGGAYMEMQFYPPGWVEWPPGDSCDPTRWCAALNIDSYNLNMNNNVPNNNACLSTVGVEPVNFAFITRSGASQAPADPVDATITTFTPDPKQDLMMNSGDRLRVAMKDSASGFEVVIDDLTSGASGSMTASVANGFGAVDYAPAASTCTVTPTAFHPMYSTSSEKTRMVWAAHSYNVAFADEIGHFEYCNAVAAQGGDCTSVGATDPNGLSSDDSGGNGYCFAPPFSSPLNTTRIKVGGCLGTEVDFDGVPYTQVWPGSGSNSAATEPTPIRFTSPTFDGGSSYGRVALEADLPRIEVPSLSPDNSCNRTTGTGCVNPPNSPTGQAFYPLFSLGSQSGACVWQLGGARITGASDSFGTTSQAEFGPLLQLAYPGTSGVIYRYNDFRNVVSSNPC